MSKLVVLIALALCATFVAGGLLGGFQDIDVDDERVVTAAKFAAQELSRKFNTAYHTKLHSVKKAQYQVVAGFNYKLHVIVGLTTCKKAEVDYEDVEDCDFQDNVSTYRKCEVRVFVDLKGKRHLKYHGCILAGRDELY